MADDIATQFGIGDKTVAGIGDKAMSGMAYRIAIYTWGYRPSSPFATTDSDVQKDRNAKSIASRRGTAAPRNQRILDLIAENWSYRDIGKALEVSKSTVGRVAKEDKRRKGEI